jgi:hypothetical protein
MTPFRTPVGRPGGSVGADSYAHDAAIDYMDMTDDPDLRARSTDARPGVELSEGRHLIVGDEDADPKVARVVAIDVEGNGENRARGSAGESRVACRLIHARLTSRSRQPGVNHHCKRSEAVRRRRVSVAVIAETGPPPPEMVILDFNLRWMSPMATRQ